jgi:hypothetical protein
MINRKILRELLSKITAWSWDAEAVQIGVCEDHVGVRFWPEDVTRDIEAANTFGVVVVKGSNLAKYDWLYYYRNDSEAD